MLKTSADAIEQWVTPTSIDLLTASKVFTEEELRARCSAKREERQA